jgi:hypothetical protein
MRLPQHRCPLLISASLALACGTPARPAPQAVEIPPPAIQPAVEPAIAQPAAPKPLARGEDSFDDPSLGRYTAHTIKGSFWSVRAGVLTARGPAIQSVLIRDDVRFADGYVEAASNRADDGGLVLRFVDENNYYLLTFRDDQAPWPRDRQNLAVYRRIGDEFREMWNTDVDWRRGTVRTIRFQARAERLSVFVDGKLILAVYDRDPPLGAGRVGVRHYGADASWVTRFHAFRWQELLAD